MTRKFEPFDERVIRRELWDLNTDDFLDLTEAMKLSVEYRSWLLDRQLR